MLEGVVESLFVSRTAKGTSDYDLSVLHGARRYQCWILSQIAPFLGNRILEVGAGTGNMSRWLPQRELLVLAEPRTDLRRQLEKNLNASPRNCLVDCIGWQWESDSANRLAQYDFDTIISFNTLEHIDRDAEAMQKLWNLLRESKATRPKHMITFVPAHNWAYGSLDKAYGHYRRYDGSQFSKLSKLLGNDCEMSVQYFNPLGLIGWLMLGKLLKLTELQEENIAFTESAISVFKFFDHLICKWLRVPVGQSLYAVFTLK